MKNTKIDTGIQTHQFFDKDDHIFASFRINPTDINLAARAQEAGEFLNLEKNKELKDIQTAAALNKEIAAVEDLNENYQIGASYFLKLRTLTFDQLWTDYLQPLLQEYVQGMYDEGSIMNRFAKAYGYKKPTEGDANETAQD